MLDRSCEELISLSELAELAFGNPYRTDLAARNSREARLRLHLERQALEVEAELATGRSSWRTATSRR